MLLVRETIKYGWYLHVGNNTKTTMCATSVGGVYTIESPGGIGMYDVIRVFGVCAT